MTCQDTAAALLRPHRAGIGLLVFWASKSTATLAPSSLEALHAAHPAITRWPGHSRNGA